jgi:hypothetical protein
MTKGATAMKIVRLFWTQGYDDLGECLVIAHIGEGADSSKLKKLCESVVAELRKDKQGRTLLISEFIERLRIKGISAQIAEPDIELNFT